MQYIRISKEDGREQKITREDVKRILAGSYQDVNIVLNEIDKGRPANCMFCIIIREESCNT